MDFASLENLFGRAIRLRKRLGEKNGVSSRWSVKLDNGETHRFTIGGVKPAEEVQDDIETMFVWLWSLKDYAKKVLESNNEDSKWIEADVNADRYLSICVDIANRAKHGKLDRKSRSGEHPKLGNLNYKIPGSAVSSICFAAFDVGINVSDPKQVTLELPVLSDDDRYLGDAFKYLDYALQFWEKIIERVDKTV